MLYFGATCIEVCGLPGLKIETWETQSFIETVGRLRRWGTRANCKRVHPVLHSGQIRLEFTELLPFFHKTFAATLRHYTEIQWKKRAYLHRLFIAKPLFLNTL